MAYSLQKSEPIHLGLKRIAREEIDAAARHLGGKGHSDRDEAIHEARKSIKKTRAIMKLMRDELGDLYTRENTSLRDVARKLSGFRDAAALIETFDDLKAAYADELNGNQLASVRQALVNEKEKAANPRSVHPLLAETAAALRKIRGNIHSWPLKTDGFKAISPGLKKTYQRGRKALARARKNPSPEQYHEFRKRVKNLWYHIRLMRSLWDGVKKDHEKDLKTLEAALGDDHNLVLLWAGISANPAAYGSAADTDLVIDLMSRRQKKLREDALSFGAKIYADKPSEYVRRLKRMCDGGDQPEPRAVPKSKATSKPRRRPAA